ncbi:gliding motility-associated C-terminal domain-containing protein [Hymenobacter sp. YC55]|uniref:T9SS type B sorting domain-containing protein n=1 Tax=Hymenobacter sp. YC55 TaxID=3034019 RepID=UPI0023F70BE6|nr:gliding motility-associated C-terminal domain-containing protein [Hymenobacter sp. YC55]MDF7815749.1 gliding motility-associated C-terminal domain-containing protein [Hymenobacter sp. YC55]
MRTPYSFSALGRIFPRQVIHVCRQLLLGICLLAASGQAAAQAPPMQWDRTLGGTEHETMQVVQQTADGGYLLAGSSNSPVSLFKSQPRRGVDDYWVIKLDAQGRREWDRTLGGTSGTLNYLSGAQQTADGGYILGGMSWSGVGGDRTAPSRGNYDYWLVKLDAHGAVQWDRAYGTNGPDYFTSLQQTADGGYILGGYTGSGVNGDKTQPLRGNTDYWVVKVDAQGVQQWDRAFGGDPATPFHGNQLQQVRQTADGGYILGGYTTSGQGGDKTQASRGSSDFWLIKLDAQGTKIWDRTLGGAGSDLLVALQPTPDGGYILAGTSTSGVGGDKSQPSRGSGDYWLVKTDAQGVKEWDRTFGGTDYDEVSSVCLGTDGGYLIGGFTRSGATGDKTQPGRGQTDQWLVKVDNHGRLQWDRTLGGADFDNLGQVQPTADGGYILGGSSSSGVSGEKSEPNQNTNYTPDGWLIKLGSPTVHITGPAVVCPGSQLQLTAASTSPILTYSWNTGATTPTLPVTQPGTYTVKVTFAGGFTSTATQQVTLFSAVPTLTGDSVLCSGRSGTLTAAAVGATAFAWSTGATTPTITLTQPGVYSVLVTYATGCTNTARIKVRAAPTPPPFTLGIDTVTCVGQPLLLRVPSAVQQAGLSYQWSTGATTPFLLVRESGTYALTVHTSCENRTTSRVVTFRACVAIPNIITPNYDKLNDVFVIQGLPGSDWSLEVYNRWGKQVYQTPIYQHDWGREVLAGTYFYVLRQAATGTLYKGWLEVVR